MRIAFRLLVLVWAVGACAVRVQASHNLAGQITYRRVGTNTFELTLTTYTDPFAAGVDRCTADIEIWAIQGGNRIFVQTLVGVPRVNGPSISSCQLPALGGEFIRPGIKRNFYRTTVTLNPGLFELRYWDIARVNNVINMDQSGSTAFYVQTILANLPSLGPNHSPLLLNDPLDDACIGRIWSHNPGAYDPDGDSLSFQLIPNRQYDPPNISSPLAVINYQYPNAFGGTFTIDPTTGLVVWDAAQVPGIYNIAIEISEWRDGVKIGEVVRDMAIFTKPCTNNPPNIVAITDTCVLPGQRLEVGIDVDDPDSPDSLYLYLNNAFIGTNGPFAVPTSPAVIVPDLTTTAPLGVSEVQRPFLVDFATLEWNVTCDHIRAAHYQVDLYAHDDVFHSSSVAYSETLADNHIIKINVRPPRVGSLVASAGSREVALSWTPNPCSNATGYRIYRSAGPGPLPDSLCCEDPNLPGWEWVGSTSGWNTTTFVDDNNGQGLPYRDAYCYRVVSEFDGVFSCPSPEACVRIRRDFPVLLNDSIGVANTDAQNGAARVRWTRPTDLDTTFYPQPLTYDLQRDAGTGFATIASGLALADTTWFDTGLNTEAGPLRYRVRVRDGNGQEIPEAASEEAGSIFLTTTALFEAIGLSWTEQVPWTNTAYEVWMSPDLPTGPYSLVATVPGTGSTQHSYTVTGLDNLRTYCFFVRGLGQYPASDLPVPLVNDSQRACDVPRDTVPPCLPATVANLQADCENLRVDLQFVLPPDSCGGDFEAYRVYRAPDSTGPYALIYQTSGPGETLWTYTGNALNGIAGCYRFTALDSLGNESSSSPHVCLDNCPILVLPNVFSPNADGINDLLRPILARSVRSLKLVIFDRWGRTVLPGTTFNLPTADTPLWNGQSQGRDVPEGVYYYQAESELNTLEAQKLLQTGTITLLR